MKDILTVSTKGLAKLLAPCNVKEVLGRGVRHEPDN